MIAINYKYYLTRPCFRTGICSYDLGDPSYIKGKIKFPKVCIFYITTSDSQGNPKCHHWDYLGITHDHLPFRICKHMFDNPAIDIIKRFVPAFHNSFSRGNELIHFMLRKPTGSTPWERRNKIPRKIRTENIGPHTDHCSGVNHGGNTQFCMVTHDQTAELKSGPTEMLGLVIP